MMFPSSSDGWTSRLWKVISIQSTLIPEGHPGLRAPQKKRGRRGAGLAILSARLAHRTTLEASSGGELSACISGHSLGLGKFNPDTVERAQSLQTGLPFSSFESGGQIIHKEIHRLVRRL